jgi:ketosteroid isomerase-like protein
MSPDQTTALVETYLAALARGETERAFSLFAPDAVQEELPNRLYEHGQRRDLAALRSSAEKGKDLLLRQSYRVTNVIVNGDGDDVAAEVEWSGDLKVGFGRVAAGSTLRARIAMFLRLRDGKIVSQRNYDCYDAF